MLLNSKKDNKIYNILKKNYSIYIYNHTFYLIDKNNLLQSANMNAFNIYSNINEIK